MADDMLGMNVDTLSFDYYVHTRVMNCFRNEEVRSISDLVKLTKADVLGWHNFGERCLCAVEDALAELGLALAKTPLVDRRDPFFPVTRFEADY